MADRPIIRIRRLAHAEGLTLPEQASAASAGFDLRAAVEEPLTIVPGRWSAVPTGLAFEQPAGFEAQVRPRSGLARRHGVTVLNSPGTIDADYRGEVQVLLINHGTEPFTVERGDRIAQVVFARVEAVTWVEVDALTDTARGAGGFGSSGVG
ncbi:MAG: dUTP diphosphatase [Acidobacteriota bacterium]